MGRSGIAFSDLDGDGTTEIILGANSATPLLGAENEFWYVMKSVGPGDYRTIWSSPTLDDLDRTRLAQIAAQDTDRDGTLEIFLGLTTGVVDVYDGRTLQKRTRFHAKATQALRIADVDEDGTLEIVTSDGTEIDVRSGIAPYPRKWALPSGGGKDLEVGDVDGDAALEIVTATAFGRGYVIDGVTHQVEWMPANGFGRNVELGDFDGNGIDEIVADEYNKLTIYSGVSQGSVGAIPNTSAGLSVTDVDGDGLPEILASSTFGDVDCYDGRTGIRKWSIDSRFSGMPIDQIGVADVDGDGTKDVVWSAGPFLTVSSSQTHHSLWEGETLSWIRSVMDVGDVDDDGTDEIVSVAPGGTIQIFDAVTKELEWEGTTGLDDAQGTWTVAIADVDGDGSTEFIVPSADGYNSVILIYDGRTHRIERQTRFFDEATYFSAIAVGDVDGDGTPEIVAGEGRSSTGAKAVSLVVFNGATAEEEWRTGDLGIYWGETYSIELADLDRDGRMDIVADLVPTDAAIVGRLRIFDGVTHQDKWFDAKPFYGLAVANVDSDPALEILLGEDEGKIEIFDGATFASQGVRVVGWDLVVSLLIEDLTGDGREEWVAGYANELAVVDGASGGVLARQDSIGWLVGLYDHLSVRDVDQDGKKELYLGTYYALYAFTFPENDVPRASTNEILFGALLDKKARLDASTSCDADGRIVLYEWDLDGDGKFDVASASPQILPRYRSSGLYTLGLRVTDDRGASSTTFAEVRALPSRLVLLSPDGGEVFHDWRLAIRWQALPSIEKLTIQYSFTGKKPWSTLTSNVPAFQEAIDGLFPPEAQPLTECRVKITGYSATGQRVMTVRSRGTFRLGP